MMKKVLILFLILSIGFILSQAAKADLVFLNSGACYEGEIIANNDDELTIRLDIGDLTIDYDDIESVQVAEKKAEPVKAEAKSKKLSEEMQVITRLKKKAARITDYRCKMRSELYDGSTISGTVVCKSPDKLKAAYLVTSNSKDIGRMEVKAVTDGEVFWLYYPQLNVIYKQVAGTEDSIAPGMDELMPVALLGKLNEGNCKYLGSELLDNVRTAHFETTMQEAAADLSGMGDGKQITKCNMYFRESDGFLLKNVGYDKEGNILFINTTRDIETNINIDENEFYFAAPEGVQVLDAAMLGKF
jgi:outer membrane lipoprotein-sorting protein